MEYGILTQEDNFFYLAPEKITKTTTGINKIMIQVTEAISWLKENSERKLIITMPLDPAGRNYIEANLWEYNDKCIALDPAILICGSHTMFKNTQVLQIGILGQIRKLISKETISI